MAAWFSRGGVRFLLVVVVLYLLTYFADPERSVAAAQFSLSLVSQIVPVLSLVFVIMLLSNLLLKTDWVKANLGKASGFRGWFIAVVGGVFSPGPIYPWLVLLKELKAHGMRPALMAVFLYSRGIKLPLLPLLIHYFGLAYAMVLLFYIPLFALLSGALMEKFPSLAERQE